MFEHDFFISYAHLDDEALIAGEHGWISELHRLLEIRVGQMRGQKRKIWRDLKLQGNDIFVDTLIERLLRICGAGVDPLTGKGVFSDAPSPA